jgi:signal transduction histidine kinase
MVTNQIISEHKGEVTFKSNLEKGTKVEVVLPINQ